MTTATDDLESELASAFPPERDDPISRARARAAILPALELARSMARDVAPGTAARAMIVNRVVRAQGVHALTRAISTGDARAHPATRGMARERLLAGLSGLPAQALRDAMIAEPGAAHALLELLRDASSLDDEDPFGPPIRLATRVRRLFPELAGMAIPAPMSVDHEAIDDVPSLPLLDHLSDRVLGRKLAGLEMGSLARFGGALSEHVFRTDLFARWKRVQAGDLAPVLRAALIFLDIAKGGDAATLERRRRMLGVDGAVHNRDGRWILERTAAAGASGGGILDQFTELREPGRRGLVMALVESHGLLGQHVRGETPLSAFAAWAAARRDVGPIADDLYVLVNALDTAGVREDLLTDGLLRAMTETNERIATVARAGAADRTRLEAALATAEDALHAGISERLSDRLRRLRASRLREGEPADEVDRAVLSIGDGPRMRLLELLRHAQLWYCEAATAPFRALSQVKLLALAAGVAGTAGIAGRPYHISFAALMRDLRREGRVDQYRVRLLETILQPLSLDALLSGTLPETQALGAFQAALGGEEAIELRFRASPEAEALLTLLDVYEKKSTAAFHATLKTLCDLYGLRKDEFDRVGNEASYLQSMNAARSDKERMLDWVMPGVIVEVGPGGGVVLDLLETRFLSGAAGERVIGLDISKGVIEALTERRTREDRKWEVMEGDAFRLAEIVPPRSVSSVVFCSVLHEIYSYVERPENPGHFRFENVRDLLRAAFRALAPGGRIVIRDGIRPSVATRVIEFIDPNGPAVLALFQKEWKARPTPIRELSATRFEMPSDVAMEFLYKYTWGPESFPYEVRECYGIMTLDEYRKALVEWLVGADEGFAARLVPVPDGMASYLQLGYRTGLEKKIRLYDGELRAVELPDSNALLVVEKVLTAL